MRNRLPPDPIAILGSCCRFLALGAGLVLVIVNAAIAGGGVLLKDDVCIIQIGFYEAHFTAYQPQTSGNTEFCEDLPNTGETIFVLDYLHGSLKEVPVDFRIIRDTTGLGRFARWEDVAKLADIDEQTVYYQEPTVKTDARFEVHHDFDSTGDYIGIVTAGHPTNDNIYNAVFPFSVGAFRFPYWALGVAFGVIAVLLLQYLIAGNRRRQAA